MELNTNELKDVFNIIKKGQAFLVMGQRYIKADPKYYSRFLKRIKITLDDHTFNELWNSCSTKQNGTKILGDALKEAAEGTTELLWLRTVMSMGWKGVYISFPNVEWLIEGVGHDFTMNITERSMLEKDSIRFGGRNIFNKKNMPIIPLFGKESELPENKSDLRKRKNLKKIFETPCEKILNSYGYLIIDGLEPDDWFDITRFIDMISAVPTDCIYFFGMSESSLENICPNEETWDAVKDLINDRRILLCSKTLKDVVEDLGFTELMQQYSSDLDLNKYIKLRISHSGDSLMIERNICSQLDNMGVTLMRDELIGSLSMRRRNILEEFATFLTQSSLKDWRYFSIKDSDSDIESFYAHVHKGAEESLRARLNEQLKKPMNERSTILLKGNSNTGKSTMLRWFAWEVYKKLYDNVGKQNRSGDSRAPERYVVLYINGKPELHNSHWMEDLKNIIKDKIYDASFSENRRVGNVVIIWDNENSSNKRADYESLNKTLNECNVVLIGSIYTFESQKLKQGKHAIEVELPPTLREDEEKRLINHLRKIDSNMCEKVISYKSKVHSREYNLFELLTQFAEYSYSNEWQTYSHMLKAKFRIEAKETERISNEEFKAFEATRKFVQSSGIGAKFRLEINKEEHDRTEYDNALEDAITSLNKILAVAGQFNRTLMIPESLLLKAVMNGRQPERKEIADIRKILNYDSMAKCETNDETGVMYISFRHHGEAIAYLKNTLGSDDDYSRINAEIDVLKKLINYCDWESDTGFAEAESVTSLIRCFGPNSYGKYGNDAEYKGNYTHYSDYWSDIADALKSVNNPDAVLIVGHFTREFIQRRVQEKQEYIDEYLNTLEEVYDDMKEYVNEEDISLSDSAQARLYGEMCRNLLEQMNLLNKGDFDESAVVADFISDFKNAVRFSEKSNSRRRYKNYRQGVGTVMLLDIWLNYVTYDDRLEKYLPETLEYIELLLYDEGEYIEEGDDLVSVLEKINKVFEYANKETNKLMELFKSKNNDSWMYYQGKKELLSIYNEFKGDLEKYALSARICFLNERAADDFIDDDNHKKLYERIKERLKVVSKKIISMFDISGFNLRDMSFRCLRMYLQAKWMCYTGNLMLEYNQRPGLSCNQWKELNEICEYCLVAAQKPEAEASNSAQRAAIFISEIYQFVYIGKNKWRFARNGESPNKLICLCKPIGNDGTSSPRIVYASTRPDDNKVKAKIKLSEKDSTNISEEYAVYVPSTVLKKHPELKRKSILNISYKFNLWFNLSGPLISDDGDEEE